MWELGTEDHDTTGSGFYFSKMQATFLIEIQIEKHFTQ